MKCGIFRIGASGLEKLFPASITEPGASWILSAATYAKHSSPPVPKHRAITAISTRLLKLFLLRDRPHDLIIEVLWLFEIAILVCEYTHLVSGDRHTENPTRLQLGALAPSRFPLTRNRKEIAAAFAKIIDVNLLVKEGATKRVPCRRTIILCRVLFSIDLAIRRTAEGITIRSAGRSGVIGWWRRGPRSSSDAITQSSYHSYCLGR